MSNSKSTVRTILEDAYVCGVLAYRNMKSGAHGELPGMSDHMCTLHVGLELEIGCSFVQSKDSVKAAFSDGFRSEW